jgi:hypothetical protein
MSKQEDVTDPARELFSDGQNEAHDGLIASGALDEQPHQLVEAAEKARKKKEQKEAREAAKKKLDDDICALAEKHDQSVAGIKLRLSQIRAQPIDTLDTSLENEQKVDGLKRELRIVESLYTELLMKVDELTEKDTNKSQGTVEEFSEQFGLTLDEAAEMLVSPRNIGISPLMMETVGVEI